MESGIPITFWHKCPFRGLPNVPLDERCPTSLKVIADPVATSEIKELLEEPIKHEGRGRPQLYSKSSQTVSHLIPVMDADSYCRRCTDEHIREQEMGMKFSKKYEKSPKKTKIRE